MAKDTKLYFCTSEDFQLPYYVRGDDVRYIKANDIPQLFWPDGTICWLANLYLLKGFKRGLSRKNKGGTLLTWAKHLSHLIRWCYNNKCDFYNLTDNHFRMFVNSIMMEQDNLRSEIKKRDNSQVATICSTILNFLAFIDQLIPGLNLVGPSGRIQAEMKTIDIKTEKGVIYRKAWIHECVPRGRKPRRRQPISSDAINRLYDANFDSDAPDFIIRRRYIMLRLFEITGARRMEVSLIKTEDILQSLSTGYLKIYTAKQRSGDCYRMIPVTWADIVEVKSFINHYRRLVISRTIGLKNDHRFLFVGMSNGMPLGCDTLGSELYELRKWACIDDEEACLHAFRHRFITKMFRNLITTHEFESESDLKKALLSAETLKVKVKEWTGHRSLSSLDYYIHMAFEEECNLKGTLDVLRARGVVESLLRSIQIYQKERLSGGPAAQLIADFSEVVDAASRELTGLIDSKRKSEA